MQSLHSFRDWHMKKKRGYWGEGKQFFFFGVGQLHLDLSLSFFKKAASEEGRPLQMKGFIKKEGKTQKKKAERRCGVVPQKIKKI